MPETSRTSWGWRSSPASACFNAIRMPKSPQPGHHVDFWPPLKILRSDTGHLPGAGPGYPNGAIAGRRVEHRGDDLVGRDRAAVVLVDALVGLAAGEPPQHVGELAGEVLLDHDHAP